MQKTKFDVLIIGGGAAGFFAAINAVELNRDLKVGILERSDKVLAKVKVSGGGRCNVTHAEFDPTELVKFYPRGEKELLGPFHRFMTGDVITWFEERGIRLKIESDGRMFPVSNDSQTIIDCFLSETHRLGISVLKKQSVIDFSRQDDSWVIHTKTDTFVSANLLIASGSDTRIWKLLASAGHTIVSPVPSLFTFNIRDDRINDLPGIAKNVTVRVLETGKNQVLESAGPLLITHWGMSGPAILKLSAWGARILKPMGYHFTIEVNWLQHTGGEEVYDAFMSKKKTSGKKAVLKYVEYDLPKRLWQNLVRASGISESDNWGDLSKHQIQELAGQLTQGRFTVKGKSTFKEEFVTAGGVELTEVNFKTFESKIQPGLYFAGEVLNIDAITGGFNFQNAWTSGFLAAKAIADFDCAKWDNGNE